MSDQWRRVEDHLRDASLYEEAAPKAAGEAWRRRLLARYGSAEIVLPDSGGFRRFLPATIALSFVLLALTLAWHYGILDAFFARHDPANVELASRRPSEWFRLALSLFDLEMPRFGLKSLLALLLLSSGLTLLVRRRSINILPMDW